MTDSNELRGSLRKAFLHYNPQAAWNGREIGELIEGVLSAIPTSGGVEGLEPGDADWLAGPARGALLSLLATADTRENINARIDRILSALSAVPGRIDLEEAAADPHADRGME